MTEREYPERTERQLAKTHMEADKGRGAESMACSPVVVDEDNGQGADPHYPTVAAWLGKRPSAPNFWAYLMANSSWSDLLLQPLEVILQTLEAANPARLAGKRRTFCTDHLSNQLNLRVELLIGYRLAEAGVVFEFGGEGQPDICCTTSSNQPVWLEVTTRTRDDIAALNDEMEATLQEVAVSVELRIPQRQLMIPQMQRQAMCTRVLEAAKAIESGGRATVALPESGGNAICTDIAPIGPSRVFLKTGPVLSDYTSNVEQEMLNVLAKKKKQAKRGDWDAMTLLVLDASRLGLSWLPPEAVWGQILPSLTIDWSTLPFVGLLLVFTSLNSLILGGVCLHRSDATPAQVSALNEIVIVLGMPPLAAV